MRLRRALNYYFQDDNVNIAFAKSNSFFVLFAARNTKVCTRRVGKPDILGTIRVIHDHDNTRQVIALGSDNSVS